MVRKATLPWPESALRTGPPLSVQAARFVLPRIEFERKLRTSHIVRLARSSSQNSVLAELAGTFLISVGLLTSQPSLAAQQAALGPQDVAAAQGRNSAEESNLLPIPTEFPPLADINELPMRDVTLSNGLRVFLIEDHEVPLVKGTLVIRGGQRASPPDKVGLASIALAVQRTGGSLQHPAEQLDDSLEMMAAGIEGGALPEAAVLGTGFECLKEDAAEVAGLLSELLTDPALPDDKILLYKGQILNVLEHRNDNASSIPRRELGKLLYGKNSVFAREPRAEQVEGIQREDVRQYIKQWQRPDAAIMGIYGDFDSRDMEQVLEDKLQGWRADPDHSPLPIPSSPIPNAPDELRLFLVDCPGATQASVAMGEMGVSIADPDAPALDILNEILNSFGGRLFNEIRSKEGLAYSVSGGFSTVTVDHPGLFVAGGQTASVGDFVAALERVLEDTTTAAPSAKVLAAAKSKTLNSFVFNFSSTEAQLQRLVGFTLLGLPQDYLFSYRDKIQAVTAQDVLGAAQRHLHPRRQLVVVAADADANRRQLEKQGRPIMPLTLD